MPIIDIAKVFSKEMDIKERQTEEQVQAQEQNLATNGGYLTFVKYALFALLGALNFRLFFSAIPGVWGTFVGLMAIMSEGLAIYCWNNQGRSSGKHRISLQVFSIAFTVVSIAHGAASVYELVNGKFALGPSITTYIFWYSHVIAFPLIFGLMIIALFVLGFTHWSAKIAKQRAKSQVEIATSQAELNTKSARLQHEADLAEQELEFQKRKLQVEMQLTGLLADTVNVEQKKISILRQVTDPLLRQRLAEAFSLPNLESAAQEKKEGRYFTPPTSTTPTNSNFYDPNNPKT